MLIQKPGEEPAYLLGKGAVVRFQYTGYGGRLQEFKGSIDSLSSDSVYLSSLKMRNKMSMAIAVADLYGFRTYSPGYQLGKSMTELALVAGNLALYYAWIAPLGWSPLGSAALSLGIAGGSYLVLKLVFTEKIRKTKAEGWQFKVVRT